MKVLYTVRLDLAFLGDNPSPALERGIQATIDDALSALERRLKKQLGRASVQVSVTNSLPIHDEPEP